MLRRATIHCALIAAVVGASCRDSTGLEGRRAPDECWYAADSGWARTIPVVVGGSIVHATGSNALVARDATSGRELWRTPVTAGPIRGYSMEEGAGVVVVPLEVRTVGLEAISGRILWTYTSPDDRGSPGGVVNSALATDSAYVYIPAWGASVSAIDSRTGVPRWVWRTPDTASTRAGTSGVTVAGDTVYAAVWKWITPSGSITQQWIVAIDRRTGTELWREVFSAPTQWVALINAPIVTSRVVAMHLWDGRLFVVDRFTRARLWESPPPLTANAVTDPPLVSGDTIFIPEGDGRTTARRITDGRILWERPAAFGPMQLALAGSRLWVEAGPYLTALDRSTGRVLWDGSIPDKPGARSSLKGIMAMRGTADGRLFISAVGGTFCLRE